MRRRDFIRVAAGCTVAAMPFTARAQQSAKPVIGYLSVQAVTERPDYLAAFHRGLAAEGLRRGAKPDG